MEENSVQKIEKILLFGGQFDPVHKEHMSMLRAASQAVQPDKIKVIPSYRQQSKGAAIASFATRVEMCKLAIADYNLAAEVDEIERTLAEQGKSQGYTMQLLQAYKARYPKSELYFLVGADQFLHFDCWHLPEQIVKLATLVVVGRTPLSITSEYVEDFQKKYATKVLLLHYTGADIASSMVQCKLAFGYSADDDLPKSVADYLKIHAELYQPQDLKKGLELLSSARREHSFRVAKLALKAANRYQLDRRQTLYAAALHDIAKSLNSQHPLLQNFVPEDAVLTDKHPVWHAFAGSYLAEHYLGIQDREILDAIAYHTTGRANMCMLEKVIYLADMLEEERDFKNIAYLRQIYLNIIDKCLAFALQYSIDYLKSRNIEIYWRTQQAWEYYKSYGNA